MSNLPSFERAVFATNRAMEFFTEKELQMRMGYSKDLWPLVLAKELIDNSLDACENAGIQPEISIIVEPDSLTVADNGPGLPIDILERSLDYMVRVSDKSHYVSPTRGQQGNALKCCWAAPFVADGEYGHVEVCTGGINHHIKVSLDRIAQKPHINPTQEEGFVKTGTLVKIHWPGIASYSDRSAVHDFYNLAFRFALFNPHASFTLNLPDREPTCFHATNPRWQKWLTNNPTSPHWYTPERLRGLIAGYLTEERSGRRIKTVREFVSEFAGLSGTAKQKAVTELAGLSGSYLHDLAVENDVHFTLVLRLWTAMKCQSRPINPKSLGVIGKEHIIKWLSSYCDSVRYSKAEGDISNSLPYVLEVGFGVQKNYGSERIILAGLNWSPVLKNPFSELDTLLSKYKVYGRDPVVVVVHLVCPKLDYVEQGKGAVDLPDEALADLEKTVKSVTEQWVELQRSNDKENKVKQREFEKLVKQYQPKKVSIKEAAHEVMQEAYIKASANNTLPANARQIMYAARPLVLALTGGECWSKSSYFTQHLLPDFIAENPDLTASWDVVFDSRGKLTEPHTGRRVDLGTLEVRRYIRNWHENIPKEINVKIDYRCPTVGSSNRYRYTLFIEKEGFSHLLEQADIANRYDIAVMSTKGMSVTASRQLVEELSKRGVTILVLHDFDKSGFSIVHTLKSNTRRYKFDVQPKIIDLGLRLADVEELQLESEQVEYDSKADPKDSLRKSGATEAECNFLVRQETSNGWSGERVELNAMPSDVFIQWLERKLREVGVSKVVPTEETLRTAYGRAHKYAILQSRINAILQNINDDDVVIPDNLSQLVTNSIEGTDFPWDAAVGDLARQGFQDETE